MTATVAAVIASAEKPAKITEWKKGDGERVENDEVVLTISNATVYVLDDEAEAKKDKLVVELIVGSIHHEY